MTGEHVGPQSHPDRTASTAAFVAIIALAAWLRLHDLGGQSLWWDEVMSLRQSRLPLPDLLAVTAEDNYPPLHNLILHAVIAAFGEGEVSLRLPSALLSILDVAAVAWIGTMLAGRRAGAMAAVFLALSGFHLWYSGEARMYALLSCTASLVAAAAIRTLATSGWRWPACAIIAGTALLYSHVYGVFCWAGVIGGGVLILILRRDPRAAVRFAAVQAITVLLYAPWLLIAIGRMADIGSSGFWIPSPTPWTLIQQAVQLLSGPFMFAVVAVGIRLCFPRVGDPSRLDPGHRALSHSESIILLACWATLPVLAGIILSLAVAPMLLSRYLIGILPALLTLTAIGLSRIRTTPSGRLAVGGVGIAVLTGLFIYVPRPRDDFRAVAAALNTELKPGDCLLMVPEAAFALRQYFRQPVPCLVTSRDWSAVTFPLQPTRILVLSTLDADLPSVPRLGIEQARQKFGPTELITLLDSRGP